MSGYLEILLEVDNDIYLLVLVGITSHWLSIIQIKHLTAVRLYFWQAGAVAAHCLTITSSGGYGVGV
jgi:hypothetical protein